MARLLSDLINESLNSKTSSKGNSDPDSIESIKDYKYEELNQLSKSQLLALSQIAVVKYYDQKKKTRNMKKVEKVLNYLKEVCDFIFMSFMFC